MISVPFSFCNIVMNDLSREAMNPYKNTTKVYFLLVFELIYEKSVYPEAQ